MDRFRGRLSHAIDLSLTSDANKKTLWSCDFAALITILMCIMVSWTCRCQRHLQLTMKTPRHQWRHPMCRRHISLTRQRLLSRFLHRAVHRRVLPSQRRVLTTSVLQRSSTHRATSLPMEHPRPSGMPDLFLAPCPATKSGTSTGIGCMTRGLP